MSRDAYVEKLKARIDGWNAQFDQWEAKAREAKADAKIAYESHLAELRRKRDTARGKLSEIQGAGEGAWEALRDGAENALKELKEGIDKATARFR